MGGKVGRVQRRSPAWPRFTNETRRIVRISEQGFSAQVLDPEQARALVLAHQLQYTSVQSSKIKTPKST
eukprot:5914205-Amphidinium_carterae.1